MVAVLVGSSVLAGPAGVVSAAPGDVEYVSVMPSGNPAGPGGAWLLDLSGDGRTIVFYGLDAGASLFQGTYLRRDGVTTRVDPVFGNGLLTAGISDGGRYLAFQDDPGNGSSVLRLRDLDTNAITTLASMGDSRASVGNCGTRLDVSDDGAVVAFSTTASLLPEDGNAWCDVYVWTATDDAVHLASAPGTASLGGYGSQLAALNPSGTHVLYTSDVDSAQPLSLSGRDLWLADMNGGRTLESVDNQGDPLNFGVKQADFSDDTTKIVFSSYSDPTGVWADGLVPSVYLRDRVTGEAVSTKSGPTPIAFAPTISGDGSWISAEIDWTYYSTAQQGQYYDVAVYDVANEVWQLASHAAAGVTVESNNQAQQAMMSADGSRVVFNSYASDLVSPAFTGPKPALYSYEIVPPPPDVSGPVVAVDFPEAPASGWYTEFPTATVTVTDPSGVASVSCEPGGAQLSEIVGLGTTTVTAIVTVAQEGTPTVICQATDALGNTGTSEPVGLRIDRTPPLIQVVFPDPPSSGSFSAGPVVGYVNVSDDSLVTEIDCTGATRLTEGAPALPLQNATFGLEVNAVGETQVVCTATNGAGLTGAAPGSTATATITIQPETLAASQVVAWGDNSVGQTSVPAGLDDAIDVAAGVYHSLALRADGTVVAWGAESENDLGQTTVPDGLGDVVAIAAGTYHNVALTSAGTVVAWGDNEFGQTTVPDGLTDVIAIAAGENHSMALKRDGTVVAWGRDNYGQTLVPAGLANVDAIGTGGDTSYAILEGGSLVAWGRDDAGQVSALPGDTDVTAVAAGRFHGIALKADGTLIAWGNSAWGQGSVPVGVTDVVRIAAGLNHNLALKGDGTVIAWGNNDKDQAKVPSDLTGVIRIAGGGEFSVALKGDSTGPQVAVDFADPPASEWYTQFPTTTVTVTDPSGVAALACDPEAAAQLSSITGLGTTTVTATLTVEGEGSLPVVCRAEDTFRNTGSSAAVNLKIDTSPPLIEVVFPDPPTPEGFIGAPVVGTVSVTDISLVTEIDCTGATVVTDGAPALPLQDTTFGLEVTTVGDTQVACTATNGAGLTGAAPGSTATTTITITPDTAPADGIPDSLQPTGTPAGSFSDGTTSGSIVDPNGLGVIVTDAPAPDGVTVHIVGDGTAKATLFVCGMTLRLAAGTEATLTCGSVIVRTETGEVQVVLDNGQIVVTIPTQAQAEVSDTATGATVENVTGAGVTITANGATTEIQEGTAPVTVNSWVLNGFKAPVDNPPVLNTGKAGRAIPLKWHLADAWGQPVTDLSAASIRVANYDCGLSATSDALEQTYAGGSSLLNLGAGDYQMNWKTSTAWAGSCRVMTLDLGGGTTKHAYFKFTK